MASPACHHSQLALDLAAASLDAAHAGPRPPLAAVCGDYPHLIPEVEAVLRAAGQLAATADRLTAIDDEPMPATLGRYTIESVLGRGAMGVAYLARDRDLGRDVAVKLLRADMAGVPTAARRFLNEARITARLEHPAIPVVHEIGTHPDGRPWMALRLIRGDTLDRLLADPARPLDRLAVFEGVCRGLAFAHENGVIHRDLKPHNVMVEPSGAVQILDWGLAKVLGDATDEGSEWRAAPARDAALTRAGQALGSPSYMPPEQTGRAGEVADRRSDVFGLGAILCHLLTGLPPFAGADGEHALRLAALGFVREAFGRLDASGADPGLIALCKRCLAPDRADRPADAGAVASAVAALRAGAARTGHAGAKARRRPRPRPFLTRAAGFLLATRSGVRW